MWIASARRSREIDRLAHERFGIPSRVLMERAGLAVFQAIQELLPEGGRLAVLCGKGNNGGDGFVVARLAHEAGFGVLSLVAATEAELTPEAADQLAVSSAQGVTTIFFDDARYARKLHDLGGFDLIVDGLLGTGAKGEVQGAVADAIDAIGRSGVPVVAIDIPSGIHCDTGEELGQSVWALRTVTFGLPKPYLFQGLGLEQAGFWSVADIGFPKALLDEPTDARLISDGWVANRLPERLRASHKGDHGSVLIVAGSDRMPGAAVLAALGALRSGAGLVTVASVPNVLRAVASRVPEATLLPLPELDGAIAPEAAGTILGADRTFHAALFGPGLTHSTPVKEFLNRVWRQWSRPCVVDADALNAVSEGVSVPEARTVLTPHPGEMGRLLQSSVAEIQCDRFRTVRAAVERYACTVLLKGAYSIVGSPDEPMLVNQTGNPGMASGGMGDVLGGVIAALLGQDLDPHQAAACAMHWHGAAGDRCADEVAPVGYLATDLAEALPRARAAICPATGCGNCDRPTFG
ncbi:MAG: NAD(P)H-hydrate dehydratase [Fimbriimonadaceae bacterium]|nr:NAD(P)H-hydrate dehydratase [Fimbriimonadaceae bacterium]